MCTFICFVFDVYLTRAQLNPDVNTFQRSYVAEIRRIDDWKAISESVHITWSARTSQRYVVQYALFEHGTREA